MTESLEKLREQVIKKQLEMGSPILTPEELEEEKKRRMKQRTKQSKPIPIQKQSIKKPTRTLILLGDEQDILQKRITKLKRGASAEVKTSKSIYGSRVSFEKDQKYSIKGIVTDIDNDGFSIVILDKKIRGKSVSKSEIGEKEYFKFNLLSNFNSDPNFEKEYIDEDGMILYQGKKYSQGKNKTSWGDQNENMPYFDVGNIVTFEYLKSNISITGVIVSQVNDEYIVKGDDCIKYYVKKNNRSLKFLPNKSRPREAVMPSAYPKKISYMDILNEPVSDEIRRMVIDILFKLFSDVLPDKVFYTPKPKEIVSTIENIEDYPYPEPLSWDDFYKQKFDMWLYSQYIKEVKKQGDIPNLDDKVEKIAMDYKDPDKIVLGLVSRYGNNFFKSTGEDMMITIQKHQGGKSILDVVIERELYKLDFNKLKNMLGADLAVVLANIIRGYLRKYPPNKNLIRREVRDEWLVKGYEKIKPTKNDYYIFDNEIITDEDRKEKRIDILRRVHQKSEEMYRKSKIKVKSSPTENDKDNKDEKHTIQETNIHYMYKDLTEYGYYLFNQVRIFERNCYASSNKGENTLEYLKYTHKPVLFLNDAYMKKYAKFFQEKFKNASLHIDQLHAIEGKNSMSSLAYYFPELVMNINDIPDHTLEVVWKNIESMLLYQIYNFVRTFKYMKYPTMRKESYPKYSPFLYQKYISTVNNKCYSDTSTGKMIINKDGKQIIQNIPLEDMTICYDPITKKFTCQTINDIIQIIESSGDSPPINPYTNYKYPEKFVHKIRERYIDDPSNVDIDIDDLF